MKGTGATKRCTLHDDNSAQNVILERLEDYATVSGTDVQSAIGDDEGLELDLDWLDEGDSRSNKPKIPAKQEEELGVFEGSENFFMD